jgi:integrase/recombinase XerD
MVKSRAEYWNNKLIDAEALMLPANYQAIRARLKVVKNKSTELTVASQTRLLLKFGVWANKPFNEMTEYDIDDYFDTLKHQAHSTRGTTKQVIKTFLKKVNPEAASTIILQKVENNLTPDSLLTENEITKMIKYAVNLRDKALFACLWDSGARKSELLSTTIKDAKFDKYGCLLWLPESKTEPRPARLVFASSYLREWLDSHPTNNNPDSPIFCSLVTPYGLISDAGLYAQIQKIAKRAGITKHVTPHKWRHTRATDLATKITEQELKNVLGWEASSKMTQIYIHLSAKDINKAMLKANNIEVEDDDGKKEVSLLATERCPRCKEINGKNRDYCSRCGLALSEEERKREQEEQDRIMKLVAEDAVRVLMEAFKEKDDIVKF